MNIDYNFPLTGAVVKTLVGRDRKRVFIVVGGVETGGEMRLLLVNGALRPAEKPKLKNPVHVKLLGRLDECELEALADADNSKIVAMIEKFDTCRE